MRFRFKDREYAKEERKRIKAERAAARDKERRQWRLHYAWWPVKLGPPDFGASFSAEFTYEHHQQIGEWRWLEYVERRGIENHGDWVWRYRPLREIADVKIMREQSDRVRIEGKRWFYYLTPIDGDPYTFKTRDTYRDDPDLKVAFPSVTYKDMGGFFVKVTFDDADRVHMKMMLE